MRIDGNATTTFSPAALRESYRQLLAWIAVWTPDWPDEDTDQLNALSARWGLPPAREDGELWTNETIVAWATDELERLATVPPSPV